MKLLITYYNDWSEEIDFEGFRIMSEEEWDEYLDEFEAEFEDGPVSIYFRDIEIEYENFEDFEDDFTVEKIEDSEAEIIMKHVGDEFGLFPDYDFGDEEEE